MFEGFHPSAIRYFEAIRTDNSRSNHKANEKLYWEGIKAPLEEFYHELLPYLNRVDRDLSGNSRRCISSPYQDARFCRATPIKEYCYLRFIRNQIGKTNAPGFFFDASLSGYRYGLTLYHADTKGMGQLREYLLDNRNFAKKVIENFQNSGLLNIQGERYKKPYVPDADSVLRELLDRKRIAFVHESPLNDTFFRRELLTAVLTAFDSVQDVYYMLTEALP